MKNYLFDINLERMDDCNHSGRKVTLDDRIDGQAAPLRDTTTVEKMNDRSILLPLYKITHYFK